MASVGAVISGMTIFDLFPGFLIEFFTAFSLYENSLKLFNTEQAPGE